MDPNLSKKIKKNSEFIERNLIRLSKVVDKLMNDGHVTLQDKTDILSAPSKEVQINTMLERLINGGGTSFTSLVESLNATGNEDIADKILQTDSSDEGGSGLQREETFFSESSDFREDEILHLYKEKQMYKVKLADMTTDYNKLQTELTVKEQRVEILSKEIQKLQEDLEENRQSMFQDDDDSETDIFRRMNKGAHSKELMRKMKDLELALDAKDEIITNLQKDVEYYKNQLDIAEKQGKKQRDESNEKDARIMILRNQVGKLQHYLQASRQNLNKINAEQKRIMEQWNKEQTERFKDIEDKVETGKKDTSKRFTTLEDKIDILIKMISGNAPVPVVRPSDKGKAVQRYQHAKEGYRKGKSTRNKN